MENLLLIFNFLNTYTGVIQAIFIILLVLITAYYALQTRSTVKAMEIQRKDNILPIVISEELIISKKTSKENCIDGKFNNIGSGPAFSIRVNFLSMDTGYKIAESNEIIDYLEKGRRKAHIHISAKDWKKLNFETINGQQLAGIYVRVHYQDYYGRITHSQRCFIVDKKSNSLEPIEGSFEFMHVGKFEGTFYSIKTFLRSPFQNFP